MAFVRGKIGSHAYTTDTIDRNLQKKTDFEIKSWIWIYQSYSQFGVDRDYWYGEKIKIARLSPHNSIVFYISFGWSWSIKCRDYRLETQNNLHCVKCCPSNAIFSIPFRFRLWFRNNKCKTFSSNFGSNILLLYIPYLYESEHSPAEDIIMHHNFEDFNLMIYYFLKDCRSASQNCSIT